jgi:hypothetical protein
MNQMHLLVAKTEISRRVTDADRRRRSGAARVARARRARS